MWDIVFFSPLPYVRTYVFSRCILILGLIQKVLSSHKKPLQILVKLVPPQFLAKLNDRSSNTWAVVPVWKLKMCFYIVFSKLQKAAEAASTTGGQADRPFWYQWAERHRNQWSNHVHSFTCTRPSRLPVYIYWYGSTKIYPRKFSPRKFLP